MLARTLSALFLALALVLVDALGTTPASSGVAGGTGFTVNSTEDAVDADPGDGVCETAPGNRVCTLRAAVQEANALPGPGSILLPAGTYVLSIPGPDEDEGATGDLDITDDLTIVGAGAATTVIDAAGLDRVFHIQRSVTVAISGVRVRNGFQDFGGGIYNRGTLVLTESVIISNVAGEGGGIENEGVLTLHNSVVRENEAGIAGGGIANRGALTLTGSTISYNVAGSAGGGLSNFGGGGSATLAGVTINANFAYGGGGIANGGELTLTNSTISGNEAVAFGGGITSVGITLVVNSTITGNGARESGGIHDLSGILAGIFDIPGAVTLKNTIVANSPRGGNCGGRAFIISGGHNLSSDHTCGFSRAADRNTTDPKLGPLQDNGGPTPTHALLAISPAIDAGDDADCPRTDQRGVLRPQGVRCDIGAFEFQGARQVPFWDEEEEHIPLALPTQGR